MARKMMAGTILALIALAVGLTVDFGDDAEATVAYSGHRNIGNYADIVTDTTGTVTADSITLHCEHVYRWRIKAIGSNDILYKFKNAGSANVTGVGYCEPLAGFADTWEVAPSWIKVLSSSGAMRYVIHVEGYESGTVAAATIRDTTDAGGAVTW